jgi:hypothetical protein
MNFRCIFWLGIIVLASCADTGQEFDEPVASKGAAADHAPAGTKNATKKASSPSNPNAAHDAPLKISEPQENCRPSNIENKQPPIWIPDTGIVVTRILKECVTLEGQEGFVENSPWMAMGIPCSGDGGKIDHKGELYDPKLISFLLSTDCAMSPTDLSAVKAAATKALGFSADAKLLAYNPLAIQYWEIPGQGDADVGFTIDLRTNASLQKIWKSFNEQQQSIPVRLYGRENAWVMGDQFFYVQGELVKTGNMTFRLVVKEVKALNADETATVKAGCEALRPARNCSKVFRN